jgi:hypothetical protein
MRGYVNFAREAFRQPEGDAFLISFDRPGSGAGWL